MPSQRVSHASIADALDRVVLDFDALIQKARLGSHHQFGLHSLEEEAQRIAAAIVAPFRTVPSTVKVTPGKRGGVWVGQ